MPVSITFSWGRTSPRRPDDAPTIHEALKQRLGREPTMRELQDEWQRILVSAREAEPKLRP